MSCIGYFISLNPDSLPCKRVIKIAACWVFVQWTEMTQCVANCRCSDHGIVRSPRQLLARCPGVLGASKFSPERESSLLQITFTVVCASNLKALVCPFSRYNLSTLGIHSRELPWKTQKQCQNCPSLFLGVREPVSLALPWCGEQDSPQLPHHIVGWLLTFRDFCKGGGLRHIDTGFVPGPATRTVRQEGGGWRVSPATGMLMALRRHVWYHPLTRHCSLPPTANQVTSMPTAPNGPFWDSLTVPCRLGWNGGQKAPWESPQHFTAAFSVVKHHQKAEGCFPPLVVAQLFSCVWLFETPWTAEYQTPLSFTISQNLLKLMSIELVMPSNHLIPCHLLLLLPSIFPSIRVFSSESAVYTK